MQLSICMMVKDEEKNLERCLKSLQPLLNKIHGELIIVDTGSTDNTVSIAKRYTDKVYFHPWNNNFSEMRNISISYAQGEWLLIIDADEEIQQEQGLINFFSSNLKNEYDAATLKIHSFLTEKNNADLSYCTALRLFKNSKQFKFEGAIHEQPLVNKVVAIETTLLHYGYISSDSSLMKTKFERNSELLINELKKDPMNLYYRFQLATTYKMHNNIRLALEQITKAYEIIKQKNIKPKSVLYVYNLFAIVLYESKKLEDAERICIEGLALDKENFDLYFVMAKVRALLGKIDEAISSYQNYLKLIKNYNQLKIVLNPSLALLTREKYKEVYLDLAILHYKKEELITAEEYISKIDIVNEGNKAIEVFLEIKLKNKKFNEIKDFYYKHLTEKDFNEAEFFKALEAKKLILVDQENSIVLCKLFAEGNSNYALFNRIRLLFEADKLDNELVENFAKQINFNTESFYEDIIYYFLKLKLSLNSLFEKILHNHLNNYLVKLNSKYDDLYLLVEEYLEKMQDLNLLANIRTKKILINFLLISGKLEETQYLHLFEKYILIGTNYITNIYTSYVLDNELIYDLKNDEECFFLYLLKANSFKKSQKEKYLQYLKKALKIYPIMYKGIKILMDKLSEKENLYKEKEIEFEGYKDIIKSKIKQLIEEGRLGEALEALSEYESLAIDDIEVFSIKAVVYLLQGNFDEAEKILKEGLKKDKHNADLWYNLGYLHQSNGKEHKALPAFRQAKLYCTDQEMLNSLEEIINNLTNN